MDKRERGIDQIIQEAMREGAFDNLPGKGKPLNLEENPHLDREWQLAYHLLKQNGFAPDFIEKRQSIEMELAAARSALARSWAWRAQALEAGEDAARVDGEWSKSRDQFEEQVAVLNKQIKDYNLSIPTSQLYRKIIDLKEEIGVLTA